MKNADTAILVFSRSAKEETSYKRLSRSRRVSAKIFDKLISHTKSLVNSVEHPVYWFDQKQQLGNDFQSRLFNACQQVFEKGHSRIVIIGNDTPALDRALLKKALKQVEKGKQVIGPSSDGGVYLFSLDRSDFNRKSFLALPWCTGDLFQELSNQLGGQDKIELLPTLSDMDTQADLHDFLNTSTLEKTILKLQLYILNIINSLSVFYKINFNLFFKLELAYFNSLRAPPAL